MTSGGGEVRIEPLDRRRVRPAARVPADALATTRAGCTWSRRRRRAAAR